MPEISKEGVGPTEAQVEAMAMKLMSRIYPITPFYHLTPKSRNHGKVQARYVLSLLDPLVSALNECRENASIIRGDWTDPRNECRAIWSAVDTALASLRAEGIVP